MQLHSGQIWLDESAWIGAEIEFEDCKVTRWKITSKISQREEFWRDYNAVGDNPVFSNVRAVFVCCDPTNPTQEAILKVRLQWQTWSESSSARAQQASPALSYAAKEEIRGLKLLMEANCSSTPKLISSKHQLQGQSDWIPGGYMDFILMELVPGKVPGDGGFPESCMPTDEWTELKAAFKKAWLECIASGIYHTDEGARNLIWDRDQQKCYIVDWESWVPNSEMSPPYLTWTEDKYAWWNVANC
ncbi:uncharacterized protein N7506_001470 [Penicillium brevicompactum]|uniref:uncharacterized protein n=1 Tax=Penicillium brevicompactum TaxID=5074 RepID=UPI00253FC125|nr:uncharacterized protein N7506_001470 [Penicillium brevicompactum]KAJ5348217.1 hypothetical protein N7506_001470 [Penicillium brevicompactum]